MSNIKFNSFLKPQLKLDTIPKPVGLDSRSWHSRLSVRHLSGLCPELVRHLSGTY
jgi:hypothetical protein